jgi:hypothetical protein
VSGPDPEGEEHTADDSRTAHNDEILARAISNFGGEYGPELSLRDGGRVLWCETGVLVVDGRSSQIRWSFDPGLIGDVRVTEAHVFVESGHAVFRLRLSDGLLDAQPDSESEPPAT